MRSPRLLSESSLERLALDFEIGFFEGVLSHEPANLTALEVLGHAYTRSGQVCKGLDIDRRLVSILPSNAICHYNLACSLSLLGEVDEAFQALSLAVKLGYKDFDYLAQDPDLENVRRDARYEALIKVK